MAALAAALRRFAFLVVAVTSLTALASLLLGLALGAGVNRALSVGFYVVGSFLLIAGFFVGNRGPVRLKSVDPGGAFGLGGRRRLRWASTDERDDTINSSAVFVVLGLTLIILGVAVDSRYRLV